MYWFAGISPEQAVAYRDHVRAREELELHKLARRMRETDGPIDAMDASFDSLVPLWKWFVDYALAGSPGVGEAEWMPFVARADTVDLPVQSSGGRRALVAAIGLEHYARLVLDRHDPPATWEVVSSVSRHGPEEPHQSTGVRCGAGPITVLTFVYPLARAVVHDRLHARRPDALLDRLLAQMSLPKAPRQRREASVLAPLVDTSPGVVPPQALVSPVWGWPAGWAYGGSSRPAAPPVGEAMTLWRGAPEHLEEPAKLSALPADEIAAALDRAGFLVQAGELDGAPLAGVSEEEVIELGHRHEVAQAGVLVADGAVRAIHVEPLQGPKDEWAALTRELGELARRLDARWLADADMD
ncbi:hypothetical protein OMK64_06570 [Cellulomonas fimi]|uniref:hypothetical protein n=1 Tax=Cellulomonas fimi TaxID=1708 RepID=UPI00234E12C4|nr:hypothetical protein [Cellulomonas fimi]MDC7121195.1 hypothetical protein [Cellulomonas fimi]